MKSAIQDVAPCRKRVEVELPPEKVNEIFDEQYGTLRENVQIKGFRKGHAPRRVLERKFGTAVGEEVRNRLFHESFYAALEENDLAPMGEPDIDVTTLTAEPDKPFSFQTEVDIRPSFDLPEYKGLKVTEKVVGVKDERVDEVIDRYRQNFASPEPVDEAAQVGDILEGHIKATVGEEEFIDEPKQRVQVSGKHLLGMPYETVEDDLAGLKAGDEKSLSLTVPDDFHNEAWRGQEMKVDIQVEQVLRAQLPDADDAFAKRLGIDSIGALRERIRNDMDAQNKREAREQVVENLVDQLIEACPFDLPETFMERQREAALQRAKMDLARYGATQELLAEQEEELKKNSAESADRSIRRGILFDAIADAEKMEISETELQVHIQELARSYQTTPAKMFRRIQEMNGLPTIAAELRDVKVSRLLLDSAEITTETVEEEETPDAEAGETKED